MSDSSASPRRKLALLGLALVTAACATVASSKMMGVEEGETGGELPSMEVVEREVRVPYVYPPEPGDEVWQMPETESRRPDFPYLPGEKRDRSLSIGTVSTGYLVNAATIRFPMPHMALLPVQAERDLNYTSDEMLELVRGGAAHVAEDFPGSTLYLGNFSNEGGGDIPYSVSHNSGRDADLSFYLVDEEGEQVSPPDLLPLDDNGEYVNEDGAVWRFDTARNWELVEGLVEAGRGRLQYIFISNPLRRMLLDHARDIDADRRVIQHAAILLEQPGGALPHNDHFHLRIYCSERDVRAGCRDFGRHVPGYRPHRSARRAAFRDAKDAVSSDDPATRLAGVRRLILLDTPAARRVFEDALTDESPLVRAAGARGLASLRDGVSDLARRLEEESHPQVRVELVSALSDVGGRDAVRNLTHLLDEPEPLRLPGELRTDLRGIVADALVDLEDPDPVPQLIELTEADDPEVRRRAERALRMITNHDPEGTSGGAPGANGAARDAGRSDAGGETNPWRAWYAQHHVLSRDEWLVEGFREAGYDVSRISVRHVWELCRAITERDYLSFNAQRVLMRLSRNEPPSLSWPKSDANFYWRRWFERRCDRFGCPPMPPEMTTLGDAD